MDKYISRRDFLKLMGAAAPNLLFLPKPEFKKEPAAVHNFPLLNREYMSRIDFANNIITTSSGLCTGIVQLPDEYPNLGEVVNSTVAPYLAVLGLDPEALPINLQWDLFVNKTGEFPAGKFQDEITKLMAGEKPEKSFWDLVDSHKADLMQIINIQTGAQNNNIIALNGHGVIRAWNDEKLAKLFDFPVDRLENVVYKGQGLYEIIALTADRHEVGQLFQFSADAEPVSVPDSFFRLPNYQDSLRQLVSDHTGQYEPVFDLNFPESRGVIISQGGAVRMTRKFEPVTKKYYVERWDRETMQFTDKTLVDLLGATGMALIGKWLVYTTSNRDRYAVHTVDMTNNLGYFYEPEEQGVRASSMPYAYINYLSTDAYTLNKYHLGDAYPGTQKCMIMLNPDGYGSQRSDDQLWMLLSLENPAPLAVIEPKINELPVNTKTKINIPVMSESA